MNRPEASLSESRLPANWRSHLLTLWQTKLWLRKVLPIAWVVLIGSIAFLWQLGSIGLVDETEPLFAEAARQMTVTGDWVTPYFNGETRFDKPPLIYWLMAIAFRTIGVNEWAVRLPSAVSAIALTGFIFYVLKKFGVALSAPQNPRVLATDPSFFKEPWDLKQPDSRWLAAWIGSGAIALNLQMILWARQGVSDMLLNACMGAALVAFFCGYAQPQRPQVQRRWYLGFYMFAALAVLTKGPVGIVVPGMIIVAFLFYVGKLWSVLREMQVLWGSVIFLLMTVPWYVLVVWAHGRTYIDDFFGYHNVERFTAVVNNHSAPWYFYFLVVLLGFLPWSIYVPWAIARLSLWQRSRWQTTPRHTHLGLFAATWFLVIFVFFTIATTKLPSYTIPLLPAASILVALAWSAPTSALPLSKRGSSGPPLHPTDTLRENQGGVKGGSGPPLHPTDTLRENQGGVRGGESYQGGVRAGSGPPLHPTDTLRENQRGVRAGDWTTAKLSPDSRQQSYRLPPKGLTLSHAINLIFLCLLAGAVWYSGNWLGDDPVMPDFPVLVAQAGILTWGGMAWGLGAIASLILILKKHPQWIWSTNLIAFILFLSLTLLPALPLMDSQRQLPLRQIATTIVESSSQDTSEIVMVGFKKPTLVFYSQRPVTYIYGIKEAIAYIKEQGTLRKISAPQTDASRTIFLVGRQNELAKVPVVPEKYERLKRSGVYQLIRFHTEPKSPNKNSWNGANNLGSTNEG